jgi:hypothetical protein
LMARLQKGLYVCDCAKFSCAGRGRDRRGRPLSLHGNGDKVLSDEGGEEECEWWPGLLAGVQAGSRDDGRSEGEL